MQIRKNFELHNHNVGRFAARFIVVSSDIPEGLILSLLILEQLVPANSKQSQTVLQRTNSPMAEADQN